MTAQLLGFILGVVLGLCTEIVLAVIYLVYLHKTTHQETPLAELAKAVNDSYCLDCGPAYVGRDGRCARCGSNAVDRNRPESEIERSDRIKAHADDFRARRRAKQVRAAGGAR